MHNIQTQLGKMLFTVLCFALFVLTAYLSPVFAAPTLPQGFEMNHYISGLNTPTKLINVPDGRMFVAEKGGTVRVIKNGTLLQQPLVDISDHVNNFEDRGLLSIAIDPDFSNNGIIYLLYTHYKIGTDYYSPQTGRLSKVQLVNPIDDTATPAINPDETVLLGSVDVSVNVPNSPCVAGSDCIPNDSGSHSVGDLAFATDGTLFVTVGDGAEFVTVDPKALRALDSNWLSGKVLHIDTDGKGLATNPFYTGDPNDVKSKVYQSGLRNPFRIVLDHHDTPYVTDVGWYSHEEVNQGQPGENFGWPCYEGTNPMAEYAQNPQTADTCQALYNSASVNPPYYTYAHSPIGAGSAGIGGAFVQNSTYPPEYQDNYFFGDYNEQWVKRIIVDHSGTILGVEDFATDFGGNVQNFTFPDGDLGWISIWTGDVYKISYVTGNRKPVAIIQSNVTNGILPLTVQFDGSGSYDPDNNALTYEWNFGDGEISTEIMPIHIYETQGIYTVTLNISDGQEIATSTLDIYAGNQAPIVKITNPINERGYIDPFELHYIGTATDPEDGDIPESQVNWKIIVHHNDHIHTALDNIHAYEGDQTLTYHGLNTWYEMQFTATDSQGLSATDVVTFTLFQELNMCTLTDNSPLAVYHLEENGNDSSLTGNNDTFISQGPTYGTGRVGDGLIFTGAGYMETPSLTLDKFTINMWIKPSGDSSIRTLVSNRPTGAQNNGFGMIINAWNSTSREVIFEIGNGTTAQAVASPYDTVEPGKWQMITATYDGTNIVIYKNGNVVAQAQATITFNTIGPIRFGQFTDATWPYTGLIDDVGIWDRALSTTEVTEIANPERALTCISSIPVEYGEVMFKVHKLDEAGTDTGNFIDGATIKILTSGTANVIQSTTSAYGWGQVQNIPIGTYDMVVYKPGYEAEWIQTACDGSLTSSTLQSSVTGNILAAYHKDVSIQANQTTWCHDVGLKPSTTLATGQIMFRVHEYDSTGTATGAYVDGATIKITDTTGTELQQSTLSANGWGQVNDVSTGTHGMMIYKPGYKSKWVQTTCGAENAPSEINNSLTEGESAAWYPNVSVAPDETTWCHDVALELLP